MIQKPEYPYHILLFDSLIEEPRRALSECTFIFTIDAIRGILPPLPPKKYSGLWMSNLFVMKCWMVYVENKEGDNGVGKQCENIYRVKQE